MRAMVLCAGLSTRLGKFGADCPKPLLPVCGIPILRYGIANLVAHGITDLIINTHHRHELFQRVIGDGSQLGVRIQYIHEPAILGTGGGLKNALPLLDPEKRDEPFVAVNGKLIFDLDFTAVIDAYRRAGDVVALMVARRVPDAKSWGALDVKTDARGPHIANILGEGEHMFCGVQVTRPSVIARLPDGESDSIRHGYLPWLRAGERVAAYDHEHGYFAEHSTPQRYLESNWALLGGTTTLRNPPGPMTGVDPSARIDPGATSVEPVRICAGATIGAVTVGPYAVVGEGARVLRSIERTVVWDRATAADATTEGAIVT